MTGTPTSAGICQSPPEPRDISSADLLSVTAQRTVSDQTFETTTKQTY